MTLGREAILSLGAATAIGLSRFGAHYAEFSQLHGAKLGFFFCSFVLMVGTLTALIVLLVSTVRLILKKPRRVNNLLYILAAVYCLVLFVWAADKEYELRRDAFGVLAEGSEPLIAAIHSYERDFKRPPSELADLVPTYISAVPKTGLSTSPDFYYHVVDPPDYRGTWTVSMVAFPFRELSYWPSQNYGKRARYEVHGWGYLPS